MIQKTKLNFTHSVNLGPIIVNKKQKIRINVPVVTEIVNIKPAFQQASNISDIPFCTFLSTFRTHRATQIFLLTLFENGYSLAFKLVLQNNFHGLLSTVVRFFSSQYL